MTLEKKTARSFVLGALAVMLALAFVATPVVAQQGAGKKKSAPVRQLWWNDSDYVARLQLTAETRQKMDAIYAAKKPEIAKLKPKKDRHAFVEALRAGDNQAAEAALGVWAEAEKQAALKDGELKLGVLSLLSSEQIEVFDASGGANTLRGPWVPRANWPIKHRQQSP